MKDNLFEMLIQLFEKALTHVKETSEDKAPQKPGDDLFAGMGDDNTSLILGNASHESTRVYHEEETKKFTSASHQFLMRFCAMKLVSQEVMELILHQLSLSKDPVISLSELKWSIRKAVSNILDFEQLAYLDLVLYQKEDGILPH